MSRSKVFNNNYDFMRDYSSCAKLEARKKEDNDD